MALGIKVHIGLGIGLSPVRRPVITWTNPELAIIAAKEHVNEGGIKISLEKMLQKIPSAK